MTRIAQLVAKLKEDVNSEESVIIDSYSQFLARMFKLILWLGIPFVGYLLLQFGQLY